MGRPTKKGIDYFPFDIDFFQDEKLVAIAGEFGLTGELTAIKLLCVIYHNGYYVEWNKMLKMKMLKELPGVSAEQLGSIVERLVEWGFFDEGLFASANVLTSRGIQERYFSIIKKRKTQGDFPFLLVSDALTPVSDAETTQSKVKKRKVNKKKKNISSDDDIKESALSSPLSITNNLDKEIEFMKGEEYWMNQLQVLHKMDVKEICAHFAAFRAQCLADGKRGHPTLQDAKTHFNNWLRIQKKHETIKSNNYATIKNDRHHRFEIMDVETKTFGGAF